jgi:hypothetical protein
MFTTLMVLLIVLVAGSAMAGAKLKIDDNSSIDLGFRLQAYLQNMDANIDPSTAGNESMRNFSLRRARFRLKGNVNEKVSMFLQTDVSGKTVQMIDAFITYKADPWAQFIMGRNMAPSGRQATTSSGALMAMDRPGLTYNSLNWGARYKYAFNASTFNGAAVPATPDAVRDNGLTLFGSGAMGNGNLKYYVGIYNGVQHKGSRDGTGALEPGEVDAVDDKDHIAFRVQYNLWDAEGGYYNSSTYLGKKKTLGIGFSYDMQPEVGSTVASATAAPGDTRKLVDYKLMSVDGFLELPSDNGNSLTVEAAYNKLDFDDAIDFMANQGAGYYVQAGYYLASGFQPWFLYEAFSSDATAGTDGTPGDFTAFRIGATYYLDGHNANVKLGFESFKPDVAMDVGGTQEDTLNSVTLGWFVTY